MAKLKNNTFPIAFAFDSKRRSWRKDGSAYIPGQGPELLGVSGTFSQGSVLNLQVRNATAKRNGQVFYDNFEGGTVGQPLEGYHHSVKPYVYEQDTPFSGTKMARVYMDGSTYSYATRKILNEPLNEIFVEAWARITTTTNDTENAQIKLFRAVNGTVDDHTRQPNIGWTWLQNHGGSNTVYQAGGADPNGWYGTSPTDAQWESFTLYCKLSDLDVSNGKRYAKTSLDDSWNNSSYPGGHFASPTGVVPASAWDGEEIATLSSAGGELDGEDFGQLFLPFFTRQPQIQNIDIDCLFINDSPERVVVGNASTWSECTKRLIQPMQSRSETIISVVVEEGNFTEADNKYLYVFNSDGTYNETGFQLQ